MHRIVVLKYHAMIRAAVKAELMATETLNVARQLQSQESILSAPAVIVVSWKPRLITTPTPVMFTVDA